MVSKKSYEITFNVAIIENHTETREALKELFNTAKGFACIGAYSSCEDALKEIDECYPDVMLMDIELDGMSGIEATSKLKEIYPNLDILVLTVFEEEEKIFKAIEAGAGGYILKSTPPQKIIEAVKNIIDGGAPITPSIAKKIFDKLNMSNKTKNEFKLTKSEKETLKYLVEGYSYERIAAEMGRSIHTVRSHIRSIYSKLYVHSKTEAVIKALENKIV